MMYGLLSNFSWTIRARIPIWAARPLFNSMASFLAAVSSSHPDAFSWAASISSFLAAKPPSMQATVKRVPKMASAGRSDKAARPALVEDKSYPGVREVGSL